MVQTVYALGLALLSVSCPEIQRIQGSRDEIVLDLKSLRGTPFWVASVEPLSQPYTSKDLLARWKVQQGARILRVPRFVEGKDLLYRPFQLFSHPQMEPMGHPVWVTDLEPLSRRETSIPWHDSIKGLTCPVDIEDFIELGTKYAVDNCPINLLLDTDNPNPSFTYTAEGEAVPIRMDWVKQWCDARYKRLTDAGVNITLVLTNLVPKRYDPDNPLHHPCTDYEKTPMGHGCFNVRTEKGRLYYRAAVQFLADRYTLPGAPHGRISGIVVGNEVQAHWVWHNMGQASVEQVAKEYAVSLRLAHLAANAIHPDLRVYVSLEHHWNARSGPDPLKGCKGRELLEWIHSFSLQGGDFPWALAFHPYPENLFEPRFWLDRTAVLRYDTPRITFKNLEVLTSFMSQEPFLYRGRPRRIILSEQGFHTPDGKNGEEIQAAAYAYAYRKVRHLPAIDAFMLHRHVSARDEGGLKLGLWTWDPEGRTGFEPGQKKKIWEVFRAADTEEWEEAFRFALPILGFDSWEEALPAENIDTSPREEPIETVLFDLHETMSQARVENSLDWRPVEVVKAAGWLAPAIFHHPREEGDAVARYTVDLPETGEGQSLRFRFGTGLMADSIDGVVFSIKVNERSLFQRHQKRQDPSFHVLDLSPWTGEQVELSLSVHAVKDTAYDWAVWVEPRILLE